MTPKFLAGAGALALGFAAPGFAQDLAQAGEDALVQETITVTAQFREQSALDVPIALTAYDGETLQNLGLGEFDELAAFVPGLVVQEQSVNNPGFVIRGITSDSGASNIEPRVSVFQNGVTIARSRGSIVQLFDLERVEVLKGPQGTLFGRSAQIGAINVISNRPTNEFDAEVTLDVGNFESFGAQGFVNVPILDDLLAVRAAATFERRDGFIENTEGGDLNGTDSVAARASLRFTPTDNYTFDLIANYSRDTPPGTSFKSGVIPALGGSTDPNEFASLNTFGGFLGGADLGVERELYDITGISTWELTDAITNVTTIAFREFESLEIFDPDGTAFDLFIFAEDAEGEQFSFDTRFNYDNGGRLRGFVGGGVFFEDGSQEVPLGFGLGEVGAFFTTIPVLGPAVDGVAPFFGDPALTSLFLTGDPAALAAAGVPSGLFQLESFTNFSDNTSFDVFAEVEYDITDRLTFTAGGRFTRDNKETLFLSEILEQPFPGAFSGLVGDSGGIISSDDQEGLENFFGGFSWRFVLAYEVTENLNTYFNYSRGRRPEVIQDDFDFDGAGGVAGAFEIIPAETVDSFEFGAKGVFFENRLQLDGAVFYYDYENFQTSIVEGGDGAAPTFVLANGGSADSVGVEIGLNATPIDNLNIFATYGYNRARFDETDSDGAPQLFGGNQFRLSPDHSFSVGFNAEYPTPFATFFLTPTYTWKSEVFFEDENQEAFDAVDPVTGAVVFSVPSVSQDGFGLLNIRAGFETLEERVRFELYAENLTNEDFIIDGGNTGGAFSIPTFIGGNPRFYGGRLTLRY